MAKRDYYDVLGVQKSSSPEQIKAADLYTWIESELLEIEVDLKAPRTNEYARADQNEREHLSNFN